MNDIAKRLLDGVGALHIDDCHKLMHEAVNEIKLLEAKLEAYIQWREVSGWKHDEQAKKIERLKKELESIEQAITDPENQPSQFGTVTLALYKKMNLEAIKWKDKYDELLEQQLSAKNNQG